MDDRRTLEARQLARLALPVPGPRTTAVRRLALPRDAARPRLYVIVTPPQIRERYLRWVTVRQSAMLAIVIMFAVLAASVVI